MSFSLTLDDDGSVTTSLICMIHYAETRRTLIARGSIMYWGWGQVVAVPSWSDGRQTSNEKISTPTMQIFYGDVSRPDCKSWIPRVIHDVVPSDAATTARRKILTPRVILLRLPYIVLALHLYPCQWGLDVNRILHKE